jgi:hypothetical protein
MVVVACVACDDERWLRSQGRLVRSHCSDLPERSFLLTIPWLCTTCTKLYTGRGIWAAA